MDPGNDAGNPSLIQDVVTSINSENRKSHLAAHAHSAPGNSQNIVVAIPAKTLVECSNLCNNEIISLKCDAADQGHPQRGSLDVFVERKNEIFLLTLKDVGSSLHDFAGSWNFVISSVDVIENSREMPKESKLWQDKVKMSHVVSNNDASAGYEDRSENRHDRNTSVDAELVKSRCDDGDGSQLTEVEVIDKSTRLTNGEITQGMTSDQCDSQQEVTETSTSPKALDKPSKSETGLVERSGKKGLVRRRGRPRKIVQQAGIREIPIKQEVDETENNKLLDPVSHCCNVCGRVFRLETTQKRHQAKCRLKVADANMITCRRCRASFESLDSYELHLSHCNSELANNLSDPVKVKTRSDDQETCDICSSIFQTRSRMLRHKYRIHVGQLDDKELTKSGRYYPCKFCDQVFNNGSSRHRHQKFYCSHNPDCKRPHCCNQCGNFFTCDEELRAHKQRKHKNALAYVCHLCGIELTSRSSIYFHNLKRHSGKPPKFKCTHCDKAFYTRNKLEKHLTSHSNDRNIQCELCGKQFKTPQHVAQHKKTIHENRYRYRCEKCGHGMEKLQYLQSHKCGRVRRIQENEKTQPPASTEEESLIQKDVTLVVSASASDNIQEPIAVTPGLIGAQENTITSHYLLPDINLITNYQTHGEPGVDPVTPSLAIPVSLNEQPYMMQTSSPTYTQFMMSDNVRY